MVTPLRETAADARAAGGLSAPQTRPLVIDLEDALLCSNPLIETFFDRLGGGPAKILEIFRALLRGKVALRLHLTAVSSLDYATLPYDREVLDLARIAKAQGRLVYLATAGSETIARGIAKQLGCFDGVLASDTPTDPSSSTTAAVLMERFGEKAVDYVGSPADDPSVWVAAHRIYAANVTRREERWLRRAASEVIIVSRARQRIEPWLKALRVHQYVKNLLVFIPLLTSHSFDMASAAAACITFAAFCLCASAVYIGNDLVDLKSDRGHPTKKERPFAAGDIPLKAGIAAMPVLLLASFACALAASVQLLVVLIAYLLLTTAYSLSLKRKMLVDIVVLAILYTSRIVAGAVAIGVDVSQWLAMFSLLMFTGLALIKRYTELTTRLDAGLSSPTSRNYRQEDLPIVGALAAAAGMNAVSIFALYISSDAVRSLYRHPHFLWMIAPMLLYWFARALMMSHRRLMHDDPIVFAIRDRVSLVTLGSIAIVVLLAF